MGLASYRQLENIVLDSGWMRLSKVRYLRFFDELAFDEFPPCWNPD